MDNEKTGERRVLVLTDGKAGHENQSKAFARALGCAFDVLPVRFKGKAAKAALKRMDARLAAAAREP